MFYSLSLSLPYVCITARLVSLAGFCSAHINRVGYAFVHLYFTRNAENTLADTEVNGWRR